MAIQTIFGGQSQGGGTIGTVLSGQDSNDMEPKSTEVNPTVSSYGYGNNMDMGFYNHMTVQKADSHVEVIGNDGKAFVRLNREDKGFQRSSNMSSEKGDCSKAR